MMEQRVVYLGKASDGSSTLLHWFDLIDRELYLDGDITLADKIGMWCYVQFGEPDIGATWAQRGGMFIFADSNFATAFRIKWC